jgi:hypothetical protein
VIETVGAVLEEAATNPDVEADTAYIRHLVDEKADVGLEDLAHEDWILPMEHTGGRTVLKIWPTWVGDFPEAEPDDHAHHLRPTGEGRIKRAPPDEYGRSTMMDMHFAPTTSAHLPNVEPVPRENTPFAESDS